MKLTRPFKIIHTSNKLLRTYYMLVFVRICLVFVPQLGYIHPDEFFQSVEVMAGEDYGLEHTRTWEYNSTFPIRSVVVSTIVFRIPLNIFRVITMYLYYYLELDVRTTYALLVFPRFVMCALSFMNDWSLYQICKSYGLKSDIRLLALASSFVMMVFGTRTFSNTIEMALCSILLYVVAECMVHSNSVIFQIEFLEKKYLDAKTMVEKVKYFKMKSALPPHSLNKCALLATICVIGCFNRPTFVIFAMPIIFFWLLRGMGSRAVTFFDFNLRVLCFVLCAIPCLIACIIIDSIYYGYLTSHDFSTLQFGIDNFVVTPINFIRYNINPENTGQHGMHPNYLHFLVNIPLLYNILGIIAVGSFFNIVFKFCRAEYKDLPRSQSAVSLMNSAIFIPVAVFSLINHQEARFLIPITTPIMLLHAPKLQTGFAATNPFQSENYITRFIYKNILSTRASAGHILRYWYLINVILTVFFAFIHQGGVVQVARHLSNSPAYPHEFHSNVNVDTHLVTSHMYSIPLSLLYLPSTKTLLVNPQTGQKFNRKRQFFLYEYGSGSIIDLHRKIKLILDLSEMKLARFQQQYKMYLAIPSSLSEELANALYHSNNTLLKYQRVKVFYPHLSTEAMPQLFVKHPTEVKTDVFDVDQTCSLFEYHKVILPYSVAAMLRQFSSIMHQFGLVLYRIEVRRKKS